MRCDFSFACKAALRMGLMMACVLLAGLGGAEGQSAPPGMVRLPGHRAPNALLQAHDLGRAATGQPVDLALTLPLRHQAELKDLLRRLYTPGDPLQGQFLTAEEFTRRFSPTESDYNAVAAYAEKRGLSVTGAHSNRLILNVAGPADKVETAFGVHLRSYLDTDGRRFHAPDTDPAIPAALAGRLTGVIGLNDAAVARPHLIRKTQPFIPRFFSNGLFPRTSFTPESIGSDPHNGGLTPKDIAAAYNIPAAVVPNAANGAGQTLAVFEVDGYNASDIAAYESAFFNSLQVPLQNVLVGQATGAAGSNANEVTLDIELMIALAPGAGKILVYEGTNSVSSLLNTYNKIATDNSAKAISTSWGIPEMDLDAATLRAENAIFQQMAAQGQSLYAASGDYGAYDDGATLSVDDPASQPYVTGVGGTTLRVAAAGGAYRSETTWADAADVQGSPFGSGGGGGVSRFWPIPAWQTGAGAAVHGGSATKRNVPDISLDADPQSGYSIYFNGGWQVYGGTSCAAPLWAAFTALANQMRAANALPSLGFANPVLYGIAAGANYHVDFHDIADGSVNLSYAAGAGYDNATGWGSFQGANLLADLAVYQSGTTSAVGKKSVNTHLLWDNASGMAALWNVSPDGTFAPRFYGPFTDGPGLNWTAKALASGPEENTYVLWTRADGAAVVWSLGADGIAPGHPQVYGPYTDGAPTKLWTATALTVGPDGVVHLLWNNTDGRACLWNVQGDGTFTVIGGYGPYTDGAPSNIWSATALTVGPDGVVHLLWNNTDSRVALWAVAADGSFNVVGGYGPYTDGAPSNIWSATTLAVGPDGMVHLLWDNTDGMACLWNVKPDGAFTVIGGYDPGNGWSATALAVGPDGMMHLLWNNTNGQVALWSVDGQGKFTVVGGYDPGNGWKAPALTAP